MQAPALALYLRDVAHFERKLEFCREILAQNMNFSPTWLIILMTAQSQNESGLTLENFQSFFSQIEINFNKQELVSIFQYFNVSNQSIIPHKTFINFILPVNREGLRKAALKRIAEDLEMLDDLKYALKRFFIQIIEMNRILSTYTFKVPEITVESQDSISKEQIKLFMNKFGKCPSETDLTILETIVKENRLKEISFIGIRKLFRQTKETEGRCVQTFKKQGEVKGQKKNNLMGKPTKSKLEFDREQISFRRNQTDLESARELKKANALADDLLNGSKVEGTPYGILKDKNESIQIYRPTSKVDFGRQSQAQSQSRYNDEILSRLKRNNELLQSELMRDKFEDESRGKSSKGLF